jgi:ferritin-like metal-binding protein YciE
MQTAHELFVHELTDMLSAERQLVEALQEQEDNSNNDQLKKAFASHRAQTEKQVERLESCFEELGEEIEETECKGIKGLIEEYQHFVEEEEPSEDIHDVFAIGAAIKVESYEINAYESLIEMAEDMGHDKAAKLLGQNLREEEATLEKMQKLSDKIKPEESGMEEEEESDEDTEEVSMEDSDDSEESGSRRKSVGGKKSAKKAGGNKKSGRRAA